MNIGLKIVNKIALYSILLMILTAVHHYYASILYQSPWRFHVAQVGVVVIVITLASLVILHKWKTTIVAKITLPILFLITIIIPVGWIGIFEGGYNHVIKNIVFLIGVPESLTSTMFPPSIYHEPHDPFYEITGMVQFVLTCMIIFYFYQFYKQRKTNQ